MNVVDETKTKMKQAVDHLKDEYKNLRTGRVNPNMLDDVKVDAYGSPTPLKSLANISVQERQLIVSPFDPSLASSIEKAIKQSPLNLNPILERNQIRVPVPPLNEELRKEIVKQAKSKTENAKVAIREIRRKSNEILRKQKADAKITEDDLKRSEKKIQDLTDENCNAVEKLFETKEKEILTV